MLTEVQGHTVYRPLIEFNYFDIEEGDYPFDSLRGPSYLSPRAVSTATFDGSLASRHPDILHLVVF